MDIKLVIKKYWPVLLVLALAIPSVWALFLNGFIKTDDGSWMVIRFSAFYQALADGQFPVRFLGRLNYGYGYPVSEFLYPGFMYFAVPFKLAGLSFVSSIKLVFIFSMVASSIFTYLWLSKIFERVPSVVGALVFTYLPYHLFDLYTRGSVGELFAFVWVSFALWMIEEKKPLFVSIGIFLLAVSHNTMFALFLPLLFIYAAIRHQMNIKVIIVSFALGILMSSFFTLPALLELPNTYFSATKISDVTDHFASWELVGILNIIILVTAFIILIKNKLNSPVTFFFIIVGTISIILATNISGFLWQYIPSSFIQFPFRLLSYALFAAAFLSAYILSELKKFQYVLSVVVIIILGIFSYQFALPKGIDSNPDSFYSTNEATTTVADEYMPKWVKQKPEFRAKVKAEVIKGAGAISNISSSSREINFDYNSSSPSVVQINTIYYPGWRAYSNGTEKGIFYDNARGLMNLKLTSGAQKMELRFGETPLRLFADVLSMLSLVALLALIFKPKIYQSINTKKWF